MGIRPAARLAFSSTCQPLAKMLSHSAEGEVPEDCGGTWGHSLMRAAPASGLRGTLAVEGGSWLRRHFHPRTWSKPEAENSSPTPHPRPHPPQVQGRLLRDGTGRTWSGWHSPKHPPSRTPMAPRLAEELGCFRELNASVLHPCPSMYGHGCLPASQSWCPARGRLVPRPREHKSCCSLFPLGGPVCLEGAVLFTQPLFLPFSYFILQTHLAFTFTPVRQTM